jgi:hypothetical protein
LYGNFAEMTSCAFAKSAILIWYTRYSTLAYKGERKPNSNSYQKGVWRSLWTCMEKTKEHTLDHRGCSIWPCRLIGKTKHRCQSKAPELASRGKMQRSLLSYASRIIQGSGGKPVGPIQDRVHPHERRPVRWARGELLLTNLEQFENLITGRSMDMDCACQFLV